MSQKVSMCCFNLLFYYMVVWFFWIMNRFSHQMFFHWQCHYQILILTFTLFIGNVIFLVQLMEIFFQKNKYEMTIFYYFHHNHFYKLYNHLFLFPWPRRTFAYDFKWCFIQDIIEYIQLFKIIIYLLLICCIFCHIILYLSIYNHNQAPCGNF